MSQEGIWARLGNLKPYHAVMGAVFLSAIVAGWGMLPGENVRIAMLERDGHSKEALELLEAAYRDGNRSYNTLHLMAQLYENEGNVERAGSILKEMVEKRPRDMALRSRLTAFYKTTQNSDALVEALKSEIGVRYVEASCRELIANRRLAGAFGEEKAAIQSCRQKGYRRPDDLVRLAGLLAVEGDIAQASSILRAIDDVKRLKESGDKFQLLALLLAEKQPKEAERRALRWIKSGKDDAFAVAVIDTFAQSDHPSSAIELAKAAGEAGDSIALTVAERLLEQSQPAAARLYLRGWLDNSALANEETAVRFIDAAIGSADHKLAFEGAKKLGLAKLPGEPALRLAASLRAAGMSSEVKEILAAHPGGFDEPGPVEAGPDTKTGSGSLAVPIPALAAEAATKPKSGDLLANWRKTFLARVTDDAEDKAKALGLIPRSRITFYHEPRAGARAHLNSKVLRKASRVLQRTKALKSLKQKKKLAQQKGPTGRQAVPAPSPALAPKPVQSGR